MTQNLNCGDKALDLSVTHVMGILNVTPDSFSDGGQLHQAGQLSLDKVLKRAEQMVADGATILDIGGESTRPGAAPVSEQEEMDRVVPVVEALAQRIDVIVSVDTSTPEVMRAAASGGAGLINDVRALGRDGAIEAAVESRLPVCLMHMQGKPANMQDNPNYDDPVGEVISFLQARIAACIEAGVPENQILVDPGFGFGKNIAHNLQLLARLEQFSVLGRPVLVGMSRKSMIAHVLGERAVDERLPASLALAVLAVERGARIIRVHDVKETVDAVRMTEAVLTATGR